jgi:hypothetical protein
MNQHFSNIGGSLTRSPLHQMSASQPTVADAPGRSSHAQGSVSREGPAAASAGSPAPTGAVKSGAAAGSSGFISTIEERVAQARANPEGGKRFAFYAAGLAFAQGLPITSCPFDPETEAQLCTEWRWFYGIQETAAYRARTAAPPAEFRKAERRKYVPPKSSKPVQTTSAAYAEQLGVEPAEGEA